MTTPTQPDSHRGQAAFCSRLSAERGLPPIGTAGSYDAVLAFELDSPWTPKLAGSRASDAHLDEAISAIGKRAKATRLLALEPREDLRDRRGSAHARVLHFTKPAGAFDAYVLREYDVARERLADLLESLAGVTAPVAPPPELAMAAAGPREILVCTHGARDACCGKFGYGFYLEMQRLAAAREGGVRIWRTSHLGGHRFAPTLLDLPSGRMFGRLAEGDAQAVLDGGAAVLGRLPAIYRGRCALPEAAQIVERELWLRRGTAFESASLRWSTSEGAGFWNVRLEAESGGEPASLDARVARVEVEAVVTPASCGRDPESEAPWRILE